MTRSATGKLRVYVVLAGLGLLAALALGRPELAALASPFAVFVALGLAVAPSGLSTDHAVGLTGLSRATTYYYRIVTRDAAGNTTTSPIGSFATSR